MRAKSVEANKKVISKVCCSIKLIVNRKVREESLEANKTLNYSLKTLIIIKASF